MTIAMTNLSSGIIPANILIVGLAASSLGADTGTVTLIGDVTGVGSGSVQTAITPGSVSYPKMQSQAPSSLLGNPTLATAAPSEIPLGAGLAFSGGALTINSAVFTPAFFHGYLAGYNTNPNGSSPLTGMDISLGSCVDSLNASFITLGSTMTKFISGNWSVGNGANGMGNGLTVAINTWYHVFAATINGLTDVFFDTSITAANKPAGTSAFRRIWSFRTDGSSHITPYLQNGDECLLVTAQTVASSFALSTTPTLFTVITPLGVITNMLGSYEIACGVTPPYAATFYCQQMGSPLAVVETQIAGEIGGSYLNVRTNLSSQIVGIAINANGVVNLSCHGWIDSRGKFL